ncbi:MAG: sigma 54-interacting transcriptional regulator [Desulfomonile tiedjei]|uniref:Sigma 54-interacting transcriptional regulator n=1 Tax=Desulfomonile tiedjei TaxID=2358 RepID=A0A9D6Z279_9BACT|nr:sigma 54-interacting transcriptional regulator [Desulfomonile tiedjei]
MQSATPHRVLYMEDDKGLAILMRRKLERCGYKVDLAYDGAEGLTMCESGSWDAIIVDHKMPRVSGLEVIRSLASRNALPASIMITGAGDETVAVEALKLGASDYVIKDVDGRYLELLPSVIEQALTKQRLLKEKEYAEEKLRQAHDELEKRVAQRTAELESSNRRLRREIEERTQIQESLAVTESRLSAIFETARDCIFLKDESLRYVLVNPCMANLLELTADAVIGRTDEGLFGLDASAHLRKVDLRVLRGETIEEEHTRIVNGIPMTFLDVKAPMHDAQGNVTGICGISRNITGRSGSQATISVPTDDYPSAAMGVTTNKARLAAETDSLVLLTGESGTGKDYLARFIHKNSKRSSGPFYAINCAAVSEGLAESELFGHETGAFTGAQRRKRGLLELAEGGTILLNEIGEMSLRLQAKLLTFLETKTFTRVGGEKTVTVDARLIAATNRDLSQEVPDGRFRRDLFYRLNVLDIKVPLLRERSEDIPLLVQQLISGLASELHLQNIPEIDSYTLRRLSEYTWPGNVRELRNLLERAIILSQGRRLELGHFGLPGLADSASDKASRTEMKRDYNEIIREMKLSLIQDALNRVGGKRHEAACLLGLTRDALKRQMTTLGLLGQNDPD